MATNTKLFSLEGKGLKLDTAADVEAHIKPLREHDVEEVRFQGNTLGVEACKVLGEVLQTKKNLEVRACHSKTIPISSTNTSTRLPTWQIYLQVVSSTRSPKRSPPSSRPSSHSQNYTPSISTTTPLA